MTEYKTCSKCLQQKSIDKFSRHNGKKSAKSGYRASCKNCDVEYNKQYRQANREKVNQAKRLWAAKNPEKKKMMDAQYYIANKEKIAEYRKNWQILNANKIQEYRMQPAVREKKLIADRIYSQKHREKNLLASRKYRTNNPEKVAFSAKSYRQRNPELMRLKSHRRRMLQKNNSFIVTKKDVLRVLSNVCFYCGSNKFIELDHVIPISRGGKHSISNLVPACRPCNASKGARFITEWRKLKNEQARYQKGLS